jgi:hypothetical protein
LYPILPGDLIGFLIEIVGVGVDEAVAQVIYGLYISIFYW